MASFQNQPSSDYASTSMVYDPYNEDIGGPSTSARRDVISLDSASNSPVPSPAATVVATISPVPSAPESASPLDPEWIKIRRQADKKEIGPVTLQEVRSLYAHGKISLQDECAGRDNVWRTIQSVPEILNLLSRTPQISEASGRDAGPKKPGQATSKASPKSGGRGFLLVIIFLLLGGGGTAAYIFFPQDPTTTPSPRPQDRGSQITFFSTKLQEWKASFPKVEQGKEASEKILKQALERFFLDRTEDYQHALNLFKRALLASPENDQAIAGLALSVLWGSPSRVVGLRQLREFDTLLREEATARRSPLLQATHAAFLAQQSDIDKGVRVAESAARRSPKDPLIHAILGELLFENRVYAKAGEHLQKAVSLSPTFLRPRYFLGQILMQEARYHAANKTFQPLSEKEHVQGIFQLSKLEMDLGKMREASAVLTRLLKLQPQMGEAHLRQGMILYQFLRDPRQALKHFEQALKLDPPRPQQSLLLLHRIYIHTELGQIQKAEEILKQLQQADPTSLPLLLAKAQVAAASRKVDDAISHVKSLTEKVRDAPLFMYLGVLFERANKHKEAREAYQQALSENSRYIWPHLLLAASQLRDKNSTQAFLHLKNAMDIEPSALRETSTTTHYHLPPRLWADDPSMPLAAAGIASYHLGDLAQAKTLLSSSLARDSNSFYSNLYMAHILLEQKQDKAAQKHAQRVYQTYNQHPLAACILAWIDFHAKNYDSASRLFSHVEDARPWYVSPRIGAAYVLLEQEQKDKALAKLQPLLTSNRSNQRLLRALYRLQW